MVRENARVIGPTAQSRLLIARLAASSFIRLTLGTKQRLPSVPKVRSRTPAGV